MTKHTEGKSLNLLPAHVYFISGPGGEDHLVDLILKQREGEALPMQPMQQSLQTNIQKFQNLRSDC